MSQARQPLQSITVLDLGQIYNGPYATFPMAMAGARVINRVLNFGLTGKSELSQVA